MNEALTLTSMPRRGSFLQTQHARELVIFFLPDEILKKIQYLFCVCSIRVIDYDDSPQRWGDIYSFPFHENMKIVRQNVIQTRYSLQWI